jgi:hypothetical protein
MAKPTLASWFDFLEAIEEWWLECTEFVNLGGRHTPGKHFTGLGYQIGEWCLNHTSVNPMPLWDLTWFIDTHVDTPLPRYEFPRVPIERIEKQVERCNFLVRYLREQAMERDTPDNGAAIVGTFLTSDLTRELKTTSKTVSKYAKDAGIESPKRGGKNHRYSGAQRQAIYQKIVATASDSDLVTRARQCLDDAGENGN